MAPGALARKITGSRPRIASIMFWKRRSPGVPLGSASKASTQALAWSKKRSISLSWRSASFFWSSTLLSIHGAAIGCVTGQLTTSPVRGMTVWSSLVQPSSRMTLACPPTTPPCGKRQVLSTPPVRATGIRLLSGFTATQARISG